MSSSSRDYTPPDSSSATSTLSPAQGDVREDYMEVDGDGVGISDTVFLML